MTASPVHLVIATPAYGRMVHQERTKWAKVIQAIGARVE